MCTAFVVVVYACYAFYMPFDAWWFLRFLLPAFPIIFVLMSAAILLLSARLPGRGRWVLPVVLVAVVAFSAWAIRRSFCWTIQKHTSSSLASPG